MSLCFLNECVGSAIVTTLMVGSDSNLLQYSRVEPVDKKVKLR